MVKRTSAVARIIATAVMAMSLTVAGPAAAQDTPNDLTSAQQIRQMVLEQREKVLAQIGAILSGEKERSRQAQVETAGEGEVTAEDGEPEGAETEGEEADGGEAEGEEPDGDESEDGDAEDEEVLELSETGVGAPRGANGSWPALVAAAGALAAVGLSVRRRFTKDLARAAHWQPEP